VIVSAQKREENIQDVPISISVLNGAALEKSTVSTLKDVLRTVPGVAGYENGQAGLTKFAVRGVTSNVSLFNGSSTVGYYFEEVPFAFVRFPVSPDANAYDLQRVEVLRGPQGTLYGANSLNGVVRILAKDADLKQFDLKGRATVSSTRYGGENYRADAAINVPIVKGKLAARAVVGYAEDSGWIDLPAAGLEDTNDGELRNVRLKVNAQPTDNMKIELLGWQYRDERGSSPISRDDRTEPSIFPQAIDNQINVYGATLTYDFPAFTVLSATSLLKFRGTSNLNNPPGSIENLLTLLEAESVSQEFRLNSHGDGPYRWSIGAIYRDSEDRRFQDAMMNISFPGNSDNIFTSASYAVFGELTRSLLDQKLMLTAGVRYFEDRSASNEIATLNPATEIPFGVRRSKFDAVTPRFVITYKPAEEISLYASYSQGFRSGFAQIGDVLRFSQGLAPDVKPDRLSNYEIGTKGSLLDSRLSYDFALYYIDWKDTVQVLTTTVSNPAGTSTFFGAINSKGVEGIGSDLGVNMRVGEGWRLGVTVSWNDLHFSEDVFSGGNLLFPRDSRPPDSSELTAGADIGYSFNIGSDFTTEIAAGADYSSRIMVAGPTAATSMLGDDIVRVNLTFTLSSIGGWSVTLFGDNLTDEYGRVRPAAGLLGQSDRLRPRTFGLQLDYGFN